MNNVGEFRAVRDISLHPIKLASKDEAEDEDVECPPPPSSEPQGTKQQLVVSPCNNFHTASIRSSSIDHLSNTHMPVVTSCSVVIENDPTEALTAATNKLKSAVVKEHTSRTKVKNSNKTLTKPADEIELVPASQHTVEADSVVGALTDSVV